MESFLSDINGIHVDIVDAELNAEQLIAGFEIQFQQLLLKLAPNKINDTPVKPSKKKIKNRTDRTDSNDVDETNIEVSSATSSSATASATNETYVRADETQQYMRPVRTARKQIVSMKEPTLNRKMRRENGSTVLASVVKVERVSNESNASTSARNTVEPSTPAETNSSSSKEPMPPPANKKVPTVKVKQEKLSILTKKSDASTTSSSATVSSNANETTVVPSASMSKRKSSDEGIASIGEREGGTRTSKKVKSNDSVELIPTDNRVIELSDDERGSDDEQRMPPPAFVPPAAKPKEKKQTKSSRSSSSVASDSGSEMAPTKRSTRSKQPRPRLIKQEPVDDTPDVASSFSNKSRPENGGESNASGVASTAKPTKENKNASKEKAPRVLNTTGESLYEDAISEPPNRIFNSYVRIEKVPEPSSSQQSDATFVSTSEENESQPLSPRATYVIPKNVQSAETSANPNATFQVGDEAAKAQPINDQTIVLEPQSNGGAMRNKKLSAASIMTEDDSDSSNSNVDVPVGNNAGRSTATTSRTATIANKKNPKELFNPCMPKTTVKQRAEAFEKLASPVAAAPRETRTRTRQFTTTDIDKFVKPQNPSKATSASTSSLRTNSATRLAQSSSKYPSASSLHKAQSVEEIRKKNQAIVDEKKKKRDEKLKQAQLQREANELEKAEKMRKIFLEKEQRIKENQQKKQMEELRKQQEQRRREAEREQTRKELKAAADRKERENMKILAEAKVLQEKLKANKRVAESEAAQYNKLNPYNFDMIESGDSTDDEGKETAKRPPPPSWSLKHSRMPYIIAQSNISSKVVDTFFSVEPRQVDLREIFPTIDDKHLRRNSSAVWNTPPRYSLMPKY